MLDRTMLRAALCGLLPVPLVAQTLAESPAPALNLRYATFDPLRLQPPVPAHLQAAEDTGLWIVQGKDKPGDAFRAAIATAGGRIVGYLPEWSYLVRLDGGGAANLAGHGTVRWVGQFHPAYRLEKFLFDELVKGEYVAARRYNLLVADKRFDKPALAAKIRALGGVIEDEQPGSVLFSVSLDSTQLLQVVRFDEVTYVDRWTPAENDMDNARIQGGGNYVETAGGYTGTGINGHVYEGIEATHPHFTLPAINVLSGGGADDHGHCTSGIIAGNGSTLAAARGMAPGIQLFFTQYSTVTTSRWNVVQALVSTHDVMFTTASWGDNTTTEYTSVSVDADDILFDHDIVWTNSQSNTGNRSSRPQAWAKNVMSIGGVQHRNNSDRADDSWDAGGASIGPATDGRIKPNLCAYYDAILCSDRTGAAGYAAGDTYTGFGGTSGATPIVAGHNALAMQMYTDHIFNNTPRVPGGTRFQNRAHNATHRALMYANARQYSFSAASTDNRREHQGWGFPDLRTMYDNRARMFIVDETDVLVQGGSVSYPITVQAGDGELKVAMVFSDPAPTLPAGFTAVNNLDLKVTAPNGTVYWGNQGLMAGNYSTPGGSADARDTVECVLINSPAAGVWTVEVSAPLIALDGHVETPAVDADFGLCVSFGRVEGLLQSFGVGCAGSTQAPPVCASINPAGGTLSVAVRANEYAYRLTAATALQVTGFEVFSAAPGGSPVTVNAGLYLLAGTQPAATPLATTTVTIGAGQAFYAATFATPVNVPAGTFFIGVNHAAQTTNLSNLTAGTTTTCSFRASSTAAWANSTLVTRPAVRVLCQGGGGSFLVPQLSITGNPSLGGSLTEALTLAKANAAGAQVLGVSDTSWSGGALPFSFGGLGAPACNLYVSPDALTSVVTNAQGAVTTSRSIPNSVPLLGVRVFEQHLILDAGANALGANASNAFRIVIGSN
ncbi:MAG: S8 family serine peptidase [Planctomycetes bacterium]|nr:S8 family serine peptidase [Planctomycetota bacterium]